MKNICAAIVASVLVVLLFIMTSEAVPAEAESHQLVDRSVRSALAEQINEDALAQLYYQYLLDLQELEDRNYAKRGGFTGISGMDMLNIMNSKYATGRRTRPGRRRRSLKTTDDLS